jgi:hypothetical protein
MIMFAFLFIIISLLNQNYVFSSPVLLWSNSNLPQLAVPLSTLSPINVISNYICKLPSEQIQVRLFAVNELTNEDIQRGSQSKHPILLDARNEQSQFRYFPNVVDDVYKAFSLIPQSNNMQCSHIHFQITSSNIYETLHDALSAMKVSVDSIGTNSNTVIVMALISGPVVYDSANRQQRDIEIYEEDVVVSDDRSCMFYAETFGWGNVYDQESSGNYTLNLENSTCTSVSTVIGPNNITSATLELHWDNGTTNTVIMTLIANITGRYWYLESAIINETQYRYFAYGAYSKMDTPPTYSYVCTTATFVRYHPEGRGSYDFLDKFYIKNLQFQPFYANGSYFGPPNYCTSFFTGGIWMGITSSLLCLGILLFGIYRMMAIKSNDRFDDPKGKPLIIKAQE